MKKAQSSIELLFFLIFVVFLSTYLFVILLNEIYVDEAIAKIYKYSSRNNARVVFIDYNSQPLSYFYADVNVDGCCLNENAVESEIEKIGFKNVDVNIYYGG